MADGRLRRGSRRVRYTTASFVAAGALTVLIATVDRKTVRPIVVERWDAPTRTVVEVVCTPVTDTTSATRYPSASGAPEPHCATGAS